MFLSDIHHATLDCMIYVIEMCNYRHGCTLYASSASDIPIEISYTTFPHTITKGLVAIYINIFIYMLKTSGVSNANHSPEHAKCLRSECVKWQKKIHDFTKCSFWSQ